MAGRAIVRPQGLHMANAKENHADFGFRRVPLEGKQALVDDVFRSVARRYDLMNDLMSGGLHRAWKEALVTALNPPPKGRPGRFAEKATQAFHVLDLAGGTGDVAMRIAAAGGSGTRVTVADINAKMLAVGRERLEAASRGPGRRAEAAHHQIDFIEANAEALPLPDKRFDAVTIAFGIRNVPRIETALAEAYRVLKTGGRFLCLEFSSVDVPALDALYDTYSYNVIPVLGRAVTGDAEAYRYLVESIRRFPRPDRFAQMMRDAGFRRVSFTRLTGGIVALHSGWRL
jgi:demethylmenaquinone methyltransferase / 2-methoxy-6-polyprenyl-1,4-benzoquinol methylase